ncbi:MAG TPA: hypothetical protein PKA64_24750, partial [Myxococcota bacterium]|nr:hypothetical protein [Myxococcota bacterium]
CPPYLQGQCLDIARPKVTRVSGLDGDGRATWSVGIPSGLAAGVGTRLQGAMHDHVDVVLTPSLDVEVAAGDVCGGAPAALSAPGFEQSTPSTWQLPAGYAWAAAPDEGANTLEITGNVAVEQWFPAVPVSALSQATFRAWHDGLDAPLMLVEWTYADGAVDLHAFQAPELAGWQTLDLLPLLDPSEKLVHVRVWGYESGVGLPDVTRLDAFALCR